MKGVPIHILDRLAPGSFAYGTVHVAEFDPDSLWYETSLAIISKALAQGIRTEYDITRRTAEEFRASLGALGTDAAKYERLGLLRLIDDYSSLSIAKPEKPTFSSESWAQESAVDLNEWTDLGRQQVQKGIAEREKRWLLVVEDSSYLLRYNSQASLDDYVKNAFLPWCKARQLLVINGGLREAGSESRWRQWESLCDGIVEFRTREASGKVEQVVRIRKMLGRPFDSAWHQLRLSDDGAVKMIDKGDIDEFGLGTPKEKELFSYLVREFIQDCMVEQLPLHVAGWRSLPDISTDARIPKSSLYTKGGGGEALGHLLRRGLLERRLFQGQRGRGGTVTRVRVNYAKGPVKEFVNQLAKEEQRKS